MRNLLLFIFILAFTSCDEFIGFSFEKQDVAMSPCQLEDPGLTAEWYSEKAYKGLTWYYYRIAESPFDNCGFKFLEQNDFASPTVSLDKWENIPDSLRVGLAQWYVKEIKPIDEDNSLFILMQTREWIGTVKNGNGICNGGNVPDEDWLYTRFEKCTEYTEIGDLFGLKK